MKCPFCGSEESTVQETRSTEDALRRRRTCTSCKQRFTTYERLGSPGLRVVKRDGSKEDFDGDKLRRALARVTRHRPVADDDLRRIAGAVEARLASRGKTVKWSDVVAVALELLGQVDAAAARRLQSNYLDENGALRLDDASPVGAEAPQLPLFDGDDDPSP